MIGRVDKRRGKRIHSSIITFHLDMWRLNLLWLTAVHKNNDLTLYWSCSGSAREVRGQKPSRPQNLLDFLLITSNLPPAGHRRLKRRLPDGFVSVFVTSSSQCWLSSLQCPNTVFTGDALAAVSNLRTSLYSLERCSPASTGQTYISGKTDMALRHKRKAGEGTEKKKKWNKEKWPERLRAWHHYFQHLRNVLPRGSSCTAGSRLYWEQCTQLLPPKGLVRVELNLGVGN